MFSVRSLSKLCKFSNSLKKQSRNLAATAALEYINDNYYNNDYPGNSYMSNYDYKNDFDDRGSPDIELFDVSMRDGLQTFTNVLSTNKKILMINQLIYDKDPEILEIGSIVSQKVLPQFHDSLEIYTWAKFEYPDKEFYLLTPNEKGVKIAIENEVSNLSFITSVSDSFQVKNIKKTLDATKEELDSMYNMALESEMISNIKLYISCINECPIEGLIDSDLIVDEVEEYYNKYPLISNICLSDTCGTLRFQNFKRIIDKLSEKVPLTNLSLHLHYSNQEDIENILLYAYDRGLTKYDVSNLENSGGCSVTIESGKTKGNLSYEDIENINF